MNVLFPVGVVESDVPDIPGLRYLPQYITPEVETELTCLIDAEPWDTSWERWRQSYGAAYGQESAGREIPAWGLRLAERMLREGISDRLFDNMLVNEYVPGQGIATHRDYSPFDRTVVSLSLLSP